jgi:hypothetical protein
VILDANWADKKTTICSKAGPDSNACKFAMYYQPYLQTFALKQVMAYE